MKRPAGHDFRVGDPVEVEHRRGQVIALADDSPMLLIRWAGTRVCDWRKAEETVYVADAGAPDPAQGES